MRICIAVCNKNQLHVRCLGDEVRNTAFHEVQQTFLTIHCLHALGKISAVILAVDIPCCLVLGGNACLCFPCMPTHVPSTIVALASNV